MLEEDPPADALTVRTRRDGARAWPWRHRSGRPTLLGVPAVGAVLLVVAQGGTRSADRAEPVRDAPPCRAQLQPDTLTIRERPARVLARVPRDLGEPRRVTVPDASGLEVLDFDADADGGVWTIAVDLAGAASGDWTVLLKGADGECEGTMTTRMPGRSD